MNAGYRRTEGGEWKRLGEVEKIGGSGLRRRRELDVVDRTGEAVTAEKTGLGVQCCVQCRVCQQSARQDKT
jgi:hypothetical protein